MSIDTIPSQLQSDVFRISIGDLKRYLSRDILKKGRPDKNVGMLNASGIQHLHFDAEGTDHPLFTDCARLCDSKYRERKEWR